MTSLGTTCNTIPGQKLSRAPFGVPGLGARPDATRRRAGASSATASPSRCASEAAALVLEPGAAGAGIVPPKATGSAWSSDRRDRDRDRRRHSWRLLWLVSSQGFRFPASATSTLEAGEEHRTELTIELSLEPGHGLVIGRFVTQLNRLDASGALR